MDDANTLRQEGDAGPDWHPAGVLSASKNRGH